MGKSSRKIFGKFNIVDILIILFAILIIFAGYSYLNKGSEEATSENMITYTVEILHSSDTLIKDMDEGDLLYDAVKGQYLGKLVKFEMKPQREMVNNHETGTVEATEVPGEVIYYLTIQGNGYVTDTDVVVENKNIKIGNKAYIKSKGYAGEGYVYHVDI